MTGIQRDSQAHARPTIAALEARGGMAPPYMLFLNRSMRLGRRGAGRPDRYCLAYFARKTMSGVVVRLGRDVDGDVVNGATEDSAARGVVLDHRLPGVVSDVEEVIEGEDSRPIWSPKYALTPIVRELNAPARAEALKRQRRGPASPGRGNPQHFCCKDPDRARGRSRR